jgi:hypothetical protein
VCLSVKDDDTKEKSKIHKQTSIPLKIEILIQIRPQTNLIAIFNSREVVSSRHRSAEIIIIIIMKADTVVDSSEFEALLRKLINE